VWRVWRSKLDSRCQGEACWGVVGSTAYAQVPSCCTDMDATLLTATTTLVAAAGCLLCISVGCIRALLPLGRC
jgi:hypothetical protein